MGKTRRKDRDGNDSNSSGSSGDTKLYLETAVLERKLPDADMRLLVDLPPGLDYNEWLASHTLALFDHANLVYGTVSEFCTPTLCPEMIGPGQRVYSWIDEKGKKTKVSAPQYVDYVMTFIQKSVTDENIFPTKYANEFPVSFESIVKKIIRLLFHVIAHLYAAHFRQVAQLGLHAHLNLTFAHLTALQNRFTLIDTKETEVLKDLEVALKLTENQQKNVDVNCLINSGDNIISNKLADCDLHNRSSANVLIKTSSSGELTENNSSGVGGCGNNGASCSSVSSSINIDTVMASSINDDSAKLVIKNANNNITESKLINTSRSLLNNQTDLGTKRFDSRDSILVHTNSSSTTTNQ